MVFDLADGNNQKGKFWGQIEGTVHVCQLRGRNLYFGSTWASTVTGTNK